MNSYLCTAPWLIRRDDIQYGVVQHCVTNNSESFTHASHISMFLMFKSAFINIANGWYFNRSIYLGSRNMGLDTVIGCYADTQLQQHAGTSTVLQHSIG